MGNQKGTFRLMMEHFVGVCKREVLKLNEIRVRDYVRRGGRIGV